MRYLIPTSLLPGLVLLLVLFRGVVIAGTFEAASTPFQAPSTGAGNSYAPVFSANGRFVAFLSHANNLVTNDDPQPHLDLFLRDLSASNTVLVSVGSNGLGGANNNVITFALSSNAIVIAFESAASNLAPGDTNRAADIFARDLVAGTTTLVSRNADGTASGNGPSTGPLISADGRYVIFESAASNLVTNDFNNTNDIFIHDLSTHTTSLVSVNADGTASPNGPSFSPSISEDGLTVAFVSRATNLVSGSTFGSWQ
jgi:Tol biopolymer transport system component